MYSLLWLTGQEECVIAAARCLNDVLMLQFSDDCRLLDHLQISIAQLAECVATLTRKKQNK